MAKGVITFKDGHVEQRNFDGYTPPYIIDAPVTCDVHIVPSGGTHGGGDPGRGSQCAVGKAIGKRNGTF